MKCQPGIGLQTTEGGCLHLRVCVGEVVVKGVKVCQETIQVVSERTEHSTVARLFARLKKESTKQLHDFL